MAKKSISRTTRRCKTKRNRQRADEVKMETAHAPLCGLGEVITEKQLFSPIHQQVFIPQKTIDYRPTDKLVFVVLGIVAGAKAISDINFVLRPQRALLQAFGYGKCADQSVIQQTLSATTEENLLQMETAMKTLWGQNNLIATHVADARSHQAPITLDIDLSGQPCAKGAEGVKKGYFAGEKKNRYGRQLARVAAWETGEILVESLYPGNTLSKAVFKEMILKIEDWLEPVPQSERQWIRLRIDAGFGTFANINFALSRGYQLLAKVYSSKHAQKLAKSVVQWVDAPSGADNTPRQAGIATCPHRYGRKTQQVVVRTPKKKGGYSYSALVTTDLSADILTIVTDYDKRGGVPESSFCQDNQGLGLRKRHKHSFVAQKMLMLLNQLAHNLTLWIKQWLIDAIPVAAEQPTAGLTFSATDAPIDDAAPTHWALSEKTLSERGIKRFVSQIFAISGAAIFSGKRVKAILLNPLYPLIDRVRTALEALLSLYHIRVLLDEI